MLEQKEWRTHIDVFINGYIYIGRKQKDTSKAVYIVSLVYNNHNYSHMMTKRRKH